METVAYDALLVVSTLAGKTLLDEAVKSTWAAVTTAASRFRRGPGSSPAQNPATVLAHPGDPATELASQIIQPSIVLQIDDLEMRELKVSGLKVLVPLDRLDDRLALALPEALERALTTGAIPPTGAFHLDDLPPFVD